MNHFSAIRARLDAFGLDAMMLTHEANRLYASGFHSAGTDGVALVTKDAAYYWTDARYIEAAKREVRDATVEMATPSTPISRYLRGPYRNMKLPMILMTLMAAVTRMPILVWPLQRTIWRRTLNTAVTNPPPPTMSRYIME